MAVSCDTNCTIIILSNSVAVHDRILCHLLPLWSPVEIPTEKFFSRELFVSVGGPISVRCTPSCVAARARLASLLSYSSVIPRIHDPRTGRSASSMTCTPSRFRSRILHWIHRERCPSSSRYTSMLVASTAFSSSPILLPTFPNIASNIRPSRKEIMTSGRPHAVRLHPIFSQISAELLPSACDRLCRRNLTSNTTVRDSPSEGRVLHADHATQIDAGCAPMCALGPDFLSPGPFAPDFTVRMHGKGAPGVRPCLLCTPTLPLAPVHPSSSTSPPHPPLFPPAISPHNALCFPTALPSLSFSRPIPALR